MDPNQSAPDQRLSLIRQRFSRSDRCGTRTEKLERPGIPRLTWRDHRGTGERVEWGFSLSRRVGAVEVDGSKNTFKGKQAEVKFRREDH